MAFFSFVLIFAYFNVKKNVKYFSSSGKNKHFGEKHTSNSAEKDILSVSTWYFEFPLQKPSVLLMDIIFAFQLGQW